jgi:glutaminyl-peptide cyclotransferase
VQPLAGGLLNLISVIPGEQPAIVVGAHYDTEATIPDFVGANDGAAGTAAVVELAKVLPGLLPEGHREVRLVLFDGEEEPAGCPEARFLQCALRGSKAYVAAHPGETGEMILLDYIANKGLQIPREQNSDPALWSRLREAAAEVGTESYFPDETQPPIIDDTTPFIQAGVPSIDLIDFSYLYADTAQDTVDKLDPAALDAVGETVAELVIALSEPPQ